MTSSWQPPNWSHPPPPTDLWTLDEIKQGNLIVTHSLNDIITSRTSSSSATASAITFGRIDDPTQIDIVTAHESCSRLHARIAFDKQGTPWLRDLGSGNGTFVNSRRLPVEACGKLEDTGAGKGSRGVVIYPGDAIQFGASTRLYCLEGPSQFERGAVKLKLMEEEKKRKEAQSHLQSQSLELQQNGNDNNKESKEETSNNNNNDEEGCSWGMADDYANDDDPEQTSKLVTNEQRSSQNDNLPSIESFFSSSSSKYTIPSSLQQLYQTYQGKLNKLQSIQLESSRILQKQDMGVELSEGQTKQLEKNQEKINTLEKDVDTVREKIEDGIHGVIHGGNGSGRNDGRGKRKTRGAERGGHDDDDDHDVDDFYDRTTSNDNKRQRHASSNGENNGAETEQSLVKKWKLLHSSRARQQEVVALASRRCAAFQSQIDNTKSNNGDEDDVDAFFIQNELTLANDNLTKAKSALDDIDKEMSDTEYLLTIVNPKLGWDRSDGWIGLKDAKPKKIETMTGEKVATATATATTKPTVITERKPIHPNHEDSSMMPPPPTSMMPIATMNNNKSSSLLSSAGVEMPPPNPNLMSPPSMTSSSRKDTIGPMRPPPITQDDTTLNNSYKKSDHNRQLGPMRPPPSSHTVPTSSTNTAQPVKNNIQGTLAALQHAVNVQSNPHSSSSSSQAHNTNTKSKKKSVAKPLFDPRKDEWNAPTDQDGSGRTTLHDKFKGRY